MHDEAGWSVYKLGNMIHFSGLIKIDATTPQWVWVANFVEIPDAYKPQYSFYASVFQINAAGYIQTAVVSTEPNIYPIEVSWKIHE